MVTQFDMESRLVRYAELRPCTTAFIDTRTPGSEGKENFTIIGGGVAENPNQFVHIDLPHGFNIGAARQSPGCVNSQHSHETAEVFIVHTGKWRFKTGHDGTDGYIDLAPGDTISLPTNVFRGFENIGEDIGFLFAVLGGDNPGHVTWAPYVFDRAARYGMRLLASGRLVDTTIETLKDGDALMPPTSLAEVAHFDRYDTQALQRCVARDQELVPEGDLSKIEGISECPVAGVANAAEGMPAAPIGWAHGFQVRALRLGPHSASPPLVRHEEEVFLMHRGIITIEWPNGHLQLSSGDTLTIPRGLARRYVNTTAEQGIAHIVRAGDHPHALNWTSPLDTLG